MEPKIYLALSLILNEWVTNAVKYAVPKDDMIELSISIYRNGKMVHVDFSDNGINNQKQPDGLGTQIISMLCKQVSGKLVSPPDRPYHHQLTIPYAG
jgi:two-component sensor histidine kinase